MVTTSNLNAMHDQEPRGRPWNSQAQRTRQRGSETQEARREAARKLQAPEVRRTPNARQPTDQPARRYQRPSLQWSDDRQTPDVQHPSATGRPTQIRNPAPT